MKRFAFLITILASLGSLNAQEMNHEEVTLPSYISILGSSNINHFSLNATLESEKSTLYETENNTLVLNIPVENFKASKKIIYKDFLELVDSSNHPNIVIEFELECLNGEFISYIDCNITLSGVSNKYRVPIYCNKIDKQQMYIKGKQEIDLNTFSIEPPQKMFHLIKVSDFVDIDFALMIDREKLIDHLASY